MVELKKNQPNYAVQTMNKEKKLLSVQAQLQNTKKDLLKETEKANILSEECKQNSCKVREIQTELELARHDL